MAKASRSADEVRGEPPAAAASLSPPAPQSRPVQVTNVIQILKDNVPDERRALALHITALEEQLTAAKKYQKELEELDRIATDADQPPASVVGSMTDSRGSQVHATL